MKKGSYTDLSVQDKPIGGELPAAPVRIYISISPPYTVLIGCGLQKRGGSILLPYPGAVKTALVCDNTGICRKRFAFSRKMAGFAGRPCVAAAYEYAKNRQDMATTLPVVDSMVDKTGIEYPSGQGLTGIFYKTKLFNDKPYMGISEVLVFAE